MKNLHIKNSYNTWNIDFMTCDIINASLDTYGSVSPCELLNRSWNSMYLEWYLHNIGYWLTLPFIYIPKIKKFNERFKHLDLKEHL